MIFKETKAGDHAFEGVYTVNNEIEEEAPGYAPMENRGKFAMADDASLCEEFDGNKDEATGKLIQIELHLSEFDDLGNLQEAFVSGSYSDNIEYYI
jgi:hypothetical protein